MPNQVYGFGLNSSHQLGMGISGASQYTSPVCNASYQCLWDDWQDVFSGQWSNSSFAPRDVGGLDTLYAWGYAGEYDLGLGDTTNRSTPTAVSTGWRQITSGMSGGLGIKTNDTLWGWGSNASGQLGLGNTTQRSTPVQIGSDTWLEVCTGGGFTLAIKSNGTLHAAGWNSSGELGLGDTTQRLSFTQVGSATWSKVSVGDAHTLAIRSNGTLWAWGNNGSGRLGLGDTTNRLTPTQVGSASNWTQVACGETFSAAINANGELWVAGANYFGALGLGDTAQRTSLTRVGSASNWVRVACGQYHLVALRADGTAWSTGRNNYGQLGLGDTTQRTTLTQIGSGTDWARVACGQSHTLLRTGVDLPSIGAPAPVAITFAMVTHGPAPRLAVSFSLIERGVPALAIAFRVSAQAGAPALAVRLLVYDQSQVAQVPAAIHIPSRPCESAEADADTGAEVIVDGEDVSASLTGDVRVEFATGGRRVASLQRLVDPDDYALSGLIGKPASVAYRGTTLVSGRVSRASLSKRDGTLAMEIANDLRRLAVISRDQADTLTPEATHSPLIYDQDSEGLAYLGERLETVPASLEYTQDGQPIIVAWSGSHDLAFDGDAADEVTISADAPDPVNRIKIAVTYRYPLLCERRKAAYYRPGLGSGGGLALPTRQSLFEAAEATGWAVEAVYVDSYAFLGFTGEQIWGRRDDGPQALVVEAQIGLRKRYTQWVDEHYEIEVASEASEAAYGTRLATSQVNVVVDFDADAWSADPARGPFFSHQAGDARQAMDTQPSDGRDALRLALETEVERARVAIKAAHRDYPAAVTTDFDAQPDVLHLARIDTGNHAVSGKIERVTHVLRADGSASTTVQVLGGLLAAGSDTPLSLPAPWQPPAPDPDGMSVALEHQIEATGDEGAVDWDLDGFAWVGLPNVPEEPTDPVIYTTLRAQMRFSSPPIESAARDPLTAPVQRIQVGVKLP